jgi:hypothetical protein
MTLYFSPDQQDQRMHPLWPDTARLPGTLPHADYPHPWGTLYDCTACHEWCYCEDLNGVDCVHCAEWLRAS